MELKKTVVITQTESGLSLRLGAEQRPVDAADEYIFRLLGKGAVEDRALIDLVAKEESLCEITAELRLAQLVLDYGDYLAPAHGSVFEV